MIEFTHNGTVSGKAVLTCVGLDAGNESDVIIPQGPRSLAGAVQFTGTFGGTVELVKSNDGTNWVVVSDLGGNPISVTSAGLFEFSTAAKLLKVTAGAGVTDVDAIIVLRG